MTAPVFVADCKKSPSTEGDKMQVKGGQNAGGCMQVDKMQNMVDKMQNIS